MKIKQIWQQYFIDIVTEHMNHINGKGNIGYYSHLETIFERVSIWLLCFVPKSVYLLFAILFVFLSPPVAISAMIIMVFRMPSNKSAFDAAVSNRFWYKKVKINNRSII